MVVKSNIVADHSLLTTQGIRRPPPIGKYTRKFILQILLVLAVLWSVIPLAWVLIISFKPDRETLARVSQQTILPKHPTLDNYNVLFENTKFLTWMQNSAVLGFATTLAVVILGSMAAYSLARFNYRGFNVFSRATLIAYMMPPIILVVPLFMLLFDLGLTDSLTGLFLVYTATRLPFAIWLLRSYFAGVPREIEDAAMVDGATRLQAFYMVVTPQAVPGMISTAIFVFSVTWHEFLYASMLIYTGDKQTLSSGVATFIAEDWIPSWGMVMAAGVMVSAPLVLIYIFLQRYLVAGWGAGSVKG